MADGADASDVSSPTGCSSQRVLSTTWIWKNRRVTPRSLVFTLFGDYLRYCGRGEVPLTGLTRMLAQFDVDPGTTRVVMTRLRKEGWFESERNGREVTYLLSDKGWRLLDEGRERIFRRRDGRWNREWSMVIVKFSERQRVARDDGIRGAGEEARCVGRDGDGEDGLRVRLGEVGGLPGLGGRR